MDGSFTLDDLAEALSCDMEMLHAVAAGYLMAELVGEHPAGSMMRLRTWDEYVAIHDEVERAGPSACAAIARRGFHVVPATTVKRTAAPARFTVYRLWRGDRLVYIGSTRNVEARMKAHLRRWPDAFDRWTTEDYPTAADMLAAEDAAIAEHMPPLNVAGVA